MLVAYSTKAFDRGELVFTTATSIVVNWFSQHPPWVNSPTPVVIMPLFLPSFLPFRDNAIILAIISANIIIICHHFCHHFCHHHFCHHFCEEKEDLLHNNQPEILLPSSFVLGPPTTTTHKSTRISRQDRRRTTKTKIFLFSILCP